VWLPITVTIYVLRVDTHIPYIENRKPKRIQELYGRDINVLIAIYIVFAHSPQPQMMDMLEIRAHTVRGTSMFPVLLQALLYSLH